MAIQGIYKITNLVNNKCYIGQTEDVYARKKVHFKKLNKQNHHSAKLQEAYNEYGEDNFSFEILETINNKELLLLAEKFYIDKYDSYNNGYNMTYPKIYPNIDNPISKEDIGKFLMMYESVKSFTYISIELFENIKNGIEENVFRKLEAYENLFDYLLFLKSHFANLSCNIYYSGENKKANGVIRIAIDYNNENIVYYSLIKNGRIQRTGLSAEIIKNDDIKMKRIVHTQSIDIKKHILFWNQEGGEISW